MILRQSRFNTRRETTRIVQNVEEAAIEVRKIARQVGLSWKDSRSLQAEALTAFHSRETVLITGKEDLVYVTLDDGRAPRIPEQRKPTI